jgi:hypothetical protein
MRLQVAGALLLVSIGAVAAGCGSGVYGGAATFETPQPAGPGVSATTGASYLLTHSSVPGVPRQRRSSTARWLPSGPSSLDAGRLLRVSPTAGHAFGALALIFHHPSADPSIRYRFECWIEGSPTLKKTALKIQLAAQIPIPHHLHQSRFIYHQLKPQLSPQPVPTGWEPFSLTVKPDWVGTASYLRVKVFVQGHVKRNSSFQIYGAVAHEFQVKQP